MVSNRNVSSIHFSGVSICRIPSVCLTTGLGHISTVSRVYECVLSAVVYNTSWVRRDACGRTAATAGYGALRRATTDYGELRLVHGDGLVAGELHATPQQLGVGGRRQAEGSAVLLRASHSHPADAAFRFFHLQQAET